MFVFEGFRLFTSGSEVSGFSSLSQVDEDKHTARHDTTRQNRTEQKGEVCTCTLNTNGGGGGEGQRTVFIILSEPIRITGVGGLAYLG